MEYTLTIDDLKQCVEFAVGYYFKNKGANASRTTGQGRGLGYIINDMVGGKAVEIGVRGMLEALAPNKRFLLDFSIHSTSKREDDPDIVDIEENGILREPRMHIEIKSFSRKDRWVGLTETQFDSIKAKVHGNLGSIILIYAGLDTIKQEDTKRADLLGSFLKVAAREEFARLFDNFASIGEIKVRAFFAITGKDLEEHGVRFTAKDFLWETEIFTEARQKLENLQELDINGATLPKYQPSEKYPYPDLIGDIRFDGKLRAFLKNNEKSKYLLLKCESDVLIKNEVLGQFMLQKGKVYRYSPNTAGRNPVIFNASRWIAARNAPRIAGEPIDLAMKEIAEKI